MARIVVCGIFAMSGVGAAYGQEQRRSFGSPRTGQASGRSVGLLCAVCLILSACAAGPVGAVRVDRQVAYEDVARSAITTHDPSWPSRNILLERGLLTTSGEGTETALAALHREMVATGGNDDLLFALAELSYLHGRTTGKRAYHLAAAVYAYAFLFPEGAEAPPGRFDPRVRLAANLYNWALTSGFASEDGAEVVPRGGPLALPFGGLEVAFDPAALRTGDRELHRFIPVAELDVYGLEMRYRWSGLGAPLAASTRLIDSSKPGRDMVAPRLQVAVTALLRIPDARRALVQGRPLMGTLELHPAWDAESVSIAGEQVPLENEPSAALALTFTGVPVFQLETLGLLGRLSGLMRDRPPLVSATPYRPGLIPAVFVHGTGSSLVRWAKMYNRLVGDPEIRKRFQFWFFQYDSGNPIALSSLRLREALTAAVERLDPEGRDPALRQMVLMGHSQGGLLTKMQVVSTGDQLWNAVARKPLDELELSDETRNLFRRGLFLEPVPMVTRAIFICTPHRGSFVAGRRVLANVTRQLLSLPFTLTGVAADINRNPGAAKVGFVPTAVDNMSPGHPFIMGLQEIPVSPSVKVNSIIAVDGDGKAEDGDDGVVKYSAAHIAPVESELVVRSGHSVQGNPHAIEEVRRILRLHAGLK
jgi:hypothetical protein